MAAERPFFLVLPSIPMTGTERLVPRNMLRPPLGLLILSGALKQAGFASRVFDLTVTKLEPEGFARIVQRERPMAVGIYSNSVSPQGTEGYIRELVERCPDVPVVVGGPGAFEHQRWFGAGATAAFTGEADHAIVPIARYLLGELEPEQIPGLAFLRDGAIVVNPGSPIIEDLDSTPMPDWDAVRVEDYHDRAFLLARHPYFTAAASRGCPYRCAFCFHGHSAGHSYRARSPENMLDELEVLTGKYGVRHVAFQDDVFGLKKGWVEEFCRGIHRRGLKFGWNAIMHPLSFIGRRRELFATMKRAGLNTLSVGVQSSVPRVLERIGRSPREPEQVVDALEAAYEQKIMTAVEYIYGLPGDTAETLKQNTRAAVSSKATVVNFHNLTIYRGTPLGEMSEAERAELLPAKVVNRELARAYLAFYTNPAAVARIAAFGGKGLFSRFAGGFLS